MYSMIGKQNCREQFIIGDYDGLKFTEKKRSTPEYGPQFYAAQSFEANGRRILIGWLFDWDIKVNPKSKSAGAMTIPREVHIIDGEMTLYPVEEAWELLKEVDINCFGASQGMVDINAMKIVTENYFEKIENIEVLIDENSTEIFVNKGRQNFSFNECNRGV